MHALEAAQALSAAFTQTVSGLVGPLELEIPPWHRGIELKRWQATSQTSLQAVRMLLQATASAASLSWSSRKRLRACSQATEASVDSEMRSESSPSWPPCRSSPAL